MSKFKIIIDTDPGVDDALAIVFAIKALLPIEAICTVYGNSTVQNSTINSLSVLELADEDIPIYTGASQPIKGKNQLAQSHGDNGLGGFSIETTKTAASSTSFEYYQETLNNSDNGAITIVAIGPTTNIGQLIQQSPGLIKKAGRIIIMGGVFGEKGNVTPYAEFNVYNDPHSLKLILESGHPEIIIVPADICRKVTFTQDIFDHIDNPNLSEGLVKISQVYIDYYSNNSEYGGFEGGVMYDLLAIALLVDQSLFTLAEANIIVETEDEERFGLTESVPGVPNCQIVTQVNSNKLKELYIKTMNT